LTVGLRDIKDVADDLARELVRAKIHPGNALHDMTTFISKEAGALLVILKESRPRK
jgi:hypothetical protein